MLSMAPGHSAVARGALSARPNHSNPPIDNVPVNVAAPLKVYGGAPAVVPLADDVDHAEDSGSAPPPMSQPGEAAVAVRDIAEDKENIPPGGSLPEYVSRQLMPLRPKKDRRALGQIAMKDRKARRKGLAKSKRTVLGVSNRAKQGAGLR